MEIMLPENQLPPHHAPTGLKLWLAVFAVVLVVALGYLVWVQNTAPNTTDNSAVTLKKTATDDETATWKTYANDQIKLTFRHPTTYSVGETLPDGTFCAADEDYCSLVLGKKSSTSSISNLIGYRRNIKTEFTGRYDTTTPPVTTLEGYLKDAFAQTDATLKTNTVLIDSRTSYWVTDPTTGDRTMIYVQVGQALYFFSFDSAATYDKLSDEQKQIIASIKFTR